MNYSRQDSEFEFAENCVNSTLDLDKYPLTQEEFDSCVEVVHFIGYTTWLYSSARTALLIGDFSTAILGFLVFQLSSSDKMVHYLRRRQFQLATA